MSHVSQTTAERKALNNTIYSAVGVTAVSKSRSASVLASTGAAASRSHLHDDACGKRGIVEPAALGAATFEEKTVEDEPMLLVPTTKFTGFIQAAQVVERAAMNALNNEADFITEVWTADGDGKIVVREMSSGSPTTKRIVATIGKYADSYATSLARSEEHVWVGYSDGALRAFRVTTKREDFEASKRHGGAITSVRCAPIPGDYGCRVDAVLTSAKDFRIHIHNAKSFEFMFYLGTPGAYVNCMQSDGDFIFSGGEDGAVRCWSLADRKEVISNVYPIHAYREGSVRSLELHQSILYAAGGSAASMWDSVTGDLLAVFHVPAPMAVNATVVNADFTLWVTGSDGLVYIFDLVELRLIQIVDTHASSHLKGVHVIRRFPVLALTVANHSRGTLFHVLSETALMDAAYEPLGAGLRQQLEMYHAAQSSIQRQRLLLHRQSATLRTIQHLHRAITNRAAVAQSGADERQHRIHVGGLQSVIKQEARNHSIFRSATRLLNEECHTNLRHNVFRKWQMFSAEACHQRGLKKLSLVLLQDAQEGLQGAWVRRAIRSHNRHLHVRFLSNVAAENARQIFRRTALRCFQRWKMYIGRSRVMVKQQDVAAILERSRQADRQSSLLRHWASVRWAQRIVQYQHAVERFAGVVQNQTASGLAHAKEVIAATDDAFMDRRDLLAKCFRRRTDRHALASLMLRWMTWSKHKGDLRRQRDIAAAKQDEARLREEMSTIEGMHDVSDEDLDRQVTEASARIAALEEMQRHREAVAKQLAAVENACLGGHTGDVDSLPAPPTSDSATCTAIMSECFTHGMNCRSHWDVMSDAYKLSATRPAAAFAASLKKAKEDFLAVFAASPSSANKGPTTATAIRAPSPRGKLSVARPVASAVRRTPGPAAQPRAAGRSGTASSTPRTAHAAVVVDQGGPWDVDRDVIDRASRVVLKKATLSLRQCVVAWFLMSAKLSLDAQVKYRAELVANAPAWLHALRRERQLEDEAIEKDSRFPWGGAAAGGSTSTPAAAGTAGVTRSTTPTIRRVGAAGVGSANAESTRQRSSPSVRAASPASLSGVRQQQVRGQSGTSPTRRSSAQPPSSTATTAAPPQAETTGESRGASRYPMARRVSAAIPSTSTARQDSRTSPRVGTRATTPGGTAPQGSGGGDRTAQVGSVRATTPAPTRSNRTTVRQSAVPVRESSTRAAPLTPPLIVTSIWE